MVTGGGGRESKKRVGTEDGGAEEEVGGELSSTNLERKPLIFLHAHICPSVGSFDALTQSLFQMCMF